MLSSSSPSSSGGSKKPKSDPRPDKSPAHNRWKTPGKQRVYNRRLLDALRHPRPANGGGAHAVKEAADSALALTAQHRSRWSRAILSGGGGRLRRVLLKARRRRPAKPPVRKEKMMATKDAKVNDRLRALGRLVPGCGKLAAPRMLEEAADYVAALEMQVRAMKALAEALSSVAALSPTLEADGP